MLTDLIGFFLIGFSWQIRSAYILILLHGFRDSENNYFKRKTLKVRIFFLFVYLLQVSFQLLFDFATLVAGLIGKASREGIADIKGRRKCKKNVLKKFVMTLLAWTRVLCKT